MELLVGRSVFGWLVCRSVGLSSKTTKKITKPYKTFQIIKEELLWHHASCICYDIWRHMNIEPNIEAYIERNIEPTIECIIERNIEPNIEPNIGSKRYK